MLLIPAIDLHDGKCVRLVRGRMQDLTVYSDNPPDMAAEWESLGAERLHLVDLDGAFAGGPRNLDVIRAVCSRVAVPVELGGGIRDVATVATVIEAGVTFAILGTAAAQNLDFLREACREFPGRIIIGIDAKDGKVSVKGWTEEISLTPVGLALKARDMGVVSIIYTDISRDGTLEGPNLESTRALALGSGMPVIVSGGMACMDDVRAVASAEPDGICGVILGKSLYEGTIDLAEAIRQVRHASKADNPVL